MNFVIRTEWGAKKPTQAYQPLDASTGGVALHWEGPAMGAFPHTECAGRIRGVQAYHMTTNGWIDIAYNFVGCPHGYVFEGRGYGHRSAAQGTNDGNARFYAVCWLSGQGDAFGDASKVAILDIVAEIRRRGAGTAVKPHSAFRATMCPGPTIGAWITAGLPAPVSAEPRTPQYSPALGPIAAVWQDETGRVIAAASPDGDVYAWACPHAGNVKGQDYWGARQVAAIGPPQIPGTTYCITATDGATYNL